MKTLIPILLIMAGTVSAQTIVRAPDAPPKVKLAAKEIRRYGYLRTGKLLPIVETGKGIVLKIDPSLGGQDYRITADGIAGGSDVGVLYGAYRYIEQLGVRFYLHGDVVPDERLKELPALNEETGKPLFELRGIQPFHDFPDGPDWWNQDDYLAYVAQLAKMRMNFIGLHCYPHRYDRLPHCGSTMIGPEPLVWLGLPQDFNADGTVKFSYPSWWDNSIRRAGWPYAGLKTSEYTGGAAALFPTDDYGPDVMKGLTPLPKTPKECNELFRRVGKQMGVVFAAAKRLGVKTCVGTETPFTVPPALAEHLKQLGKKPNDPKTIAELYEGAFRRIAAVMPVDYYWLWTAEGALHNNPNAVKNDLLIAHDALRKSGAAMTLATCGWGFNPAYDAFLPKECPLGGISGQFGHDPLSPDFARVTGRPKWAIPWAENDVNLIGYEPWVGRFRYDAWDAKRMGCTGFMALHWHTKFLMHNFAALARSSWDQSYVPASFQGRRDAHRTMPVADYYVDFARSNFGREVAEEAGKILAAIDGDGFRPDMSGWSPVWGAQGCLLTDSSLWKQAELKGATVERFAALRPQVTGAGNLERFDYWLNTLRASVVMYEAGAARGDMLARMKRVNAEADPAKKKELARQAIPLRIAMTEAWNKLVHLQILVTDTPGELGVLSNLERNSRKDGRWLDAWDEQLTGILGGPLPAACTPATQFTGPAMIKMLTVRSAAAKGESLKLRIIALPATDVVVHVRPLGRGPWRTLSAKHAARAVFEAVLPAAEEDYEYYITAGKNLVWPATAPEMNQTIVITE